VIKQGSFESWLRPNDVERLKVSRPEIGRGTYGYVYPGRLKFKGGEWKRVAVKVFDKPLSQDNVKAYREMVQRLAKADVRMPKVGYMMHEGEYVQVMPFFGSSSKIKISPFPYPDLQTALEVAEQAARIVGAGFRFHQDSLHFIRTKTGVTVPYVIDFDRLNPKEKDLDSRYYAKKYGLKPNGMDGRAYASARYLEEMFFAQPAILKQALDHFFARLPASEDVKKAQQLMHERLDETA